MAGGQVCPKRRRERAEISEALGLAWARVRAQIGTLTFAERIGADEKSVRRWLGGPELPCAVHLLNSLAADPSALDEVLRLYGLRPAPIEAESGDDHRTIAGLSRLAGGLAEALADGRRDHRETLALAGAAQPLIAQLQALVAEADKVRGIN